ncbi:MAG: glycoside hydrolase family 140 protein, partial [Cytophagaceae bacterium]|nr:glycoside hydrolase family 140 protein [Cytophagaceae bacterium]
MRNLLLLLTFNFSLSTFHSNAQLQALKVSDNKRFLVKADGTPFFWLGDTAWELFHRLKREEAEMYFKKRAEQGFTVIQAVALAELDGLRTPNAYGQMPLQNDDPNKPNEAYFKYVDELIDLAAKNNLYIGLLPTWGDKLNKMQWGKGPEIFNPTNARSYGKWIGNRYKTRTNIVWILGGDRNPRPGSPDVETWQNMAAGIQEGVGGLDKALMTYHPQPVDHGSSSNWFHNDNWLDINMMQNGHCRDQRNYDKMAEVYALTPVKPVLDGEPIYEDHPVCFNPKELGHSNAYDVRKYAYFDVFAGAFGHTYGCHSVWQMWDKTREPVNLPLKPWNESLELNGARQMQHLRTLIESRPFLDRVPDQTMLVDARSAVAEHIQATRGTDYLFAYSAMG